MKYLLPVCVALAMSFGAANAEMAAPAPATKAAPKAAAKERTAKSLECSKEADAKGLKGKERQKFRNACKKT